MIPCHRMLSVGVCGLVCMRSCVCVCLCVCACECTFVSDISGFCHGLLVVMLDVDLMNRSANGTVQDHRA
jgi:hypothetical protein